VGDDDDDDDDDDGKHTKTFSPNTVMCGSRFRVVSDNHGRLLPHEKMDGEALVQAPSVQTITAVNDAPLAVKKPRSARRRSTGARKSKKQKSGARSEPKSNAPTDVPMNTQQVSMLAQLTPCDLGAPSRVLAMVVVVAISVPIFVAIFFGVFWGISCLPSDYGGSAENSVPAIIEESDLSDCRSIAYKTQTPLCPFWNCVQTADDPCTVASVGSATWISVTDHSEPSGCAWNSENLWFRRVFGGFGSETDAAGKEWAEVACAATVDMCVVTGAPEGTKTTASVTQASAASQCAGALSFLGCPVCFQGSYSCIHQKHSTLTRVRAPRQDVVFGVQMTSTSFVGILIVSSGAPTAG
jgi:hypothetical protein